MRKMFEDLVFLGRIEKEYELFGKKWVLSTLTAEEQVDATAITGELDTISRINALKVQFLARSIKKIDGNEFIDVSEAVEVINKLQFPVINSLFAKYEEIQREQEKGLEEIDDLKN